MEILAIIELNLSHHIPSNQIQIFILFLSSSAVKNPPANAGNAGDMGSTLGELDALEEEMATHSSILAWKIPRTEELCGL